MGVTDPPLGARRSQLLWSLVGLVCTGALLALLAFGLLKQSPNKSIDDQLGRAQPATPPGFELPVLEVGAPGHRLRDPIGTATRDGLVDLAELRGYPVVVNFWASWCQPCREEAPLLARAWRHDRADGVIYVGVDEKDVTDDARRFLARYGVSYLNVRSPAGDVSLKWGATGYPETYFLSARGEVVSHVAGVLSPAQIVAGVNAAKTGRALSRTGGGAQENAR